MYHTITHSSAKHTLRCLHIILLVNCVRNLSALHHTRNNFSLRHIATRYVSSAVRHQIEKYPCICLSSVAKGCRKSKTKTHDCDFVNYGPKSLWTPSACLLMHTEILTEDILVLCIPVNFKAVVVSLRLVSREYLRVIFIRYLIQISATAFGPVRQLDETVSCILSLQTFLHFFFHSEHHVAIPFNIIIRNG